MAGRPAKVIYINTQYVETDAVSFKSVVQNLTGKDSVVDGGDSPRGKSGRKLQPPARRAPIKVERSEYYQPEMEAGQPEMMGCRTSFFMTRDLSFKEFDRTLKDLPSIDDFHALFD